MRRLIAIGALVGFAALVLAQVSGTSLLNGFTQALNSAKTLSATFTVQQPIGASTKYHIDLAKPDKARIDTTTQLIVADGQTITTYNKAQNSYYKQPQTSDSFKSLFASDDMSLFAPFFDASYYNGAVAAKASGTRTRQGVQYNVLDLSMDKSGKKTVSFYLDQKDKLARVADIVFIDGQTKDDTLIQAKDLVIDGNLSNAFAFNAPDGSKEVDINADRWFTSWAEASAAAKASGKPIFIDFYTDWCHWCKVLDAQVYPTAEFKAEAKNWVLLKIDAEKGEGVGLASQYGVNAYPTIKFVKADGTLIGGFEGFIPTAQVVDNMQKGRGAR